MKFALIALLFTLNNVFAADCSSVNLVAGDGSPFKKMPVYDQDGIGACYAYAAAQLMDYEIIRSTGEQRSVHPLWSALKYSESKNQDKISSGITYYTVQEVIKAGNCHYDKISTALSVWAQKANVREAEVMNLIEKFAPKLQSLHEAKKIMTDPTAELTAEEVDKVIAEAIEEHKPFCSPNATWEQLLPELRSLSVMNSRKMLASLVLPVCNTNLSKLNIPGPKFWQTENDGEWLTTIESKLDSLATPVSISYCSKVLYEPGYDGIERKTASKAAVHAENCGGHESLIVGKKKIGDQCHLLLRNSWGTGFSESTKNWKCLCKERATGKLLDDCSNDTHNNGLYTVEGCWISAAALGKNTFGATWLEKTTAPKTQKRKR